MTAGPLGSRFARIRRVGFRGLAAIALLLLAIRTAPAQDTLGTAPPAAPPRTSVVPPPAPAGDFQVAPGGGFTETPSPAAQYPPAVLVLENRTIATFRAPFSGYSPEERVRAATRRIRDILGQGDPGPVTTQVTPQGVGILLGGELAFGLQPGDVNVLAGETIEEEVRRSTAALGEAIEAWRDQRSLGHILMGVAQVLVASLVLALLLKLLQTLEARLRKRLAELATHRLGQVERTGLTLVDRQRVLRVTDRGAGLLAWVVRLVLLFLWLTFLLSRFPYTAPWGEAMGRHLGGVAGNLALQIVQAVPGLVTVLLIIILTRFLVGLVRLAMAGVESGQINLPWVDAEVAAPARRLIILVLWLGAAVMAYPYLPGSDSLAFKGIGLLFGLMASLGGSRLIGQAISGFVVMFARAIRKGEFVRIGETEGLVTSINLMSVRMRTYRNEEITIPASLILDTVTKNYSRLADRSSVYIHTTVTIGYGVPWRQVHAMLLEAARRTPGIKRDPEPFVLQIAMTDFYVEYQLNAALEEPTRRILALNELHQHIQDCFNEHGVQIMSPHYEGDPAEKVWVPKERWFEAPASRPDGSLRKAEP